MSDHDDIRQTIQTYFDGMYESSADKTREAFHPNARITGYLEDGLHEMTVDDFAGFVTGQQPSPSEQGVAGTPRHRVGRRLGADRRRPGP